MTAARETLLIRIALSFLSRS
ncbi:hypothetical protein BQ8794_200083 [Mesorhizobium prunaredense]|uniref:Uncharacterized protein n=1 Tax=Mesorhizobium prunaredense TaxID=1631249 RepID=A0A1R3V5H8_9HYPH|nr:hypothetical protein BQ8794_200083 [Mesorhizobium prunaredense]